ncbi:MAG: MOSC domain-containing protein [Nitrospinaceae bacterium]|nr:MOSC domain-containing protein [Nitrospinaceae bacterium]NIR53668.1 MOSC domain-containing protein [Nitrospinaceae bacterium]NIS84075.1 MOSC domain-containing protein [Nitrospinaceae bacterium]NIT80879.1 MOSC domain-containing protein [Nitrospinaceae bacterium]NIU43178.1 MOSC domain-containing protein [Nitrospinaceae bacterium]
MVSAILKRPVGGRIFLDSLGFEGDGSADLRHHGGADKAVCAYCLDHYPFWEQELKRSLEPGAFGENLSLQGLPETEVHIGDIFQIGEARIQCSQPRQPCHKLNKVFGRQDMACRVQTTGFSGYYFRVLQTGWVTPGDPVDRVTRDPAGISVDEANTLMHENKNDGDGLRRILSVPALSESWRETFERRLDKAKASASSRRLKGV